MLLIAKKWKLISTLASFIRDDKILIGIKIYKQCTLNPSLPVNTKATPQYIGILTSSENSYPSSSASNIIFLVILMHED